jgi:uncharacterized damage-inducible protein DinB
MIRTISDFQERWKNESDATINIFRHLTDESLSAKVHPDTRTLGRLANHLIETIYEFGHKLGLGLQEQHIVYKSVAELTAAYEAVSNQFLQAVTQQWNDSSLLNEVEMYGEPWKNGLSLYNLIAHQVHHRGQMTTLMRQAGLRVPGIYGPSREEWVAYNMQPQE